MINVSNEFKQTMHTRTDFKEYAEITLVDGTVINLDETQFTVTNNSVTDGAALSSVPIGVAVQKIAQLEVLNDQEQWGNYDFFGAKIRLYMTFALSNSTEKVERGLYTVTTPETYGETVIITAYDDMYKADKNYSTTLSFPNTLKNMLIDICQTCSIPLLSTTFPHDDFTISTEPDGQYTYRQIISYIAMLAGGNARINNAGYLEIITFSGITSNAYYGNLDGIETGAPEHVLSEWQSLTMDKNDITVTGVAIKIDTQSGQEKRLTGNDGYVLTVSNPLINSEDETTLATAMHNVSEHLIGLKFRKFDGVSVSNPLIEFMDFVAVKDRRGRLYQSFVTDITFTFLGTSTIKNSAESAVRTETVYAGNVNTEIRMRKLVETEKSARELAVSNLSNALANSSGLYETAETQPDGSTIYYLHDKPTLSESKSVIKLTAEAIGLSTDGGKTYPYGFTITGEMVTRLLAVEGVNADWIKTGSLTVKDGSGSSIFSADMDSGTVTMSSALVSIDGKSFESKFAESKSYTDTQVAGATTTAATALDTANAAKSSIDNLSVGGRNLLRGTKALNTDVTPTGGALVYDKYNDLACVPTTRAWLGIGFNLPTVMTRYNLKSGDTLTYSVMVMVDFTPVRDPGFTLFRAFDHSIPLGSIHLEKNVWRKLSVAFTLDDTSVSTNNTRLETNYYENDDYTLSDGNHMYFAAPKLELGNIATDWTPAPEDMATADDMTKITNRVTTAETSIANNKDAIELRATKTEVTTVKNIADAANTAASNAQSTADGVKTDLATNYSTTTQMASAIKQTADSITSTVSSVSTTATEALNKANSAASDAQAASSRIEQLKDSITLSVTDGTIGNTAKIKLGIDNETREASIDLTGAVSFSDLSTAGKTTINGSNITTGTLSADRIDAAALFAKDITTTGNFQVNNSGHGIRLEDGVFKVGCGIWKSLAKWGYISFDGNAMTLNTIGPGGQINITSSAGVNITGTTLINGLQAANIPGTGGWTPTVEGASNYTLREGHYAKIGNSIALISFAIYGTFSGSTTSRIKITGCPIVSATGQDAGGGNLSGYYSASNVVFTGWNINKAGAIYAVGQQTGTTGATWGSTAIYQKASGDFSASGMIMVQTA